MTLCPDCKSPEWLDVDCDLRKCKVCGFVVHKDWLKTKELSLDDINWEE